MIEFETFSQSLRVTFETIELSNPYWPTLKTQEDQL